MGCVEGTYFHIVDDDGRFDLFVWVISMRGECADGLRFVEMLCPADGLVGQKSTDETHIADGAVGMFKFVYVMSIPTPF